ncbi:hypothetical protein M422DRAFT_40019 [Sphaerobolus stellatus SS14]|uniref:Uncharacterized protein n=1 Tax=Sphaerobolus stellatus (strain SS14) TaxID=990650 RepID=A0A0C9UBT2_SPHS4|nr:hypothetical protein M422DRAFT_40019 [Sphaerobolus stellatus SS14]
MQPLRPPPPSPPGPQSIHRWTLPSSLLALTLITESLMFRSQPCTSVREKSDGLCDRTAHLWFGLVAHASAIIYFGTLTPERRWSIGCLFIQILFTLMLGSSIIVNVVFAFELPIWDQIRLYLFTIATGVTTYKFLQETERLFPYANDQEGPEVELESALRRISQRRRMSL